MTQAAYSTQGAIALISMNNPPVNGLGYELRSGIVAGLDQALADILSTGLPSPAPAEPDPDRGDQS